MLHDFFALKMDTICHNMSLTNIYYYIYFYISFECSNVANEAYI